MGINALFVTLVACTKRFEAHWGQFFFVFFCWFRQISLTFKSIRCLDCPLVIFMSTTTMTMTTDIQTDVQGCWIILFCVRSGDGMLIIMSLYWSYLFILQLKTSLRWAVTFWMGNALLWWDHHVQCTSSLLPSHLFLHAPLLSMSHIIIWKVIASWCLSLIIVADKDLQLVEPGPLGLHTQHPFRNDCGEMPHLLICWWDEGSVVL